MSLFSRPKRHAARIEYGRTTTVLGTGWKAQLSPLDRLSPERLAAWWARTDYGWRCSHCPNAAGVWFETIDGAKADAEEHAAEHPGATVKEI